MAKMDGIIPLALQGNISKQLGSITAGLSYKGSVPTVAGLPANAQAGDEYTVTSEGNALYLYNGTEWISFPVSIGSKSELETITVAQINALFA